MLPVAAFSVPRRKPRMPVKVLAEGRAASPACAARAPSETWSITRLPSVVVLSQAMTCRQASGIAAISWRICCAICGPAFMISAMIARKISAMTRNTPTVGVIGSQRDR